MSLNNEVNKRSTFTAATGRWSISRRLTLLNAASSFVLLSLATVYLYWSLDQNLEQEDTAFLANKIEECRRLLRERPDDMQLLTHEIQVEAAASQFIKYYIRLADESGRVLLETPGMSGLLAPESFPQAIEVAEIPRRAAVLKVNSGDLFLAMSAWGALGGQDRKRLIQVALNDSSDAALLATQRRKLVLVLAVGIVFAGIAGVFVAKKGLQPLEELVQATERVTASQLHERILPNGWPTELAPLASGFDRMLARLEDSFSRLTQFSGDLAHELRTPINNLRGEAGVALSQARPPEEYRRVLESSLEEHARLSRLIDNLLFLARAEGPMTSIDRQQCDLRAAVKMVREYFEAVAEDRGVELTCEGEAVINADPLLLRQAISNLVSNALNNTPRRSKVHLTIAKTDHQTVEIRVADTGCGIATEHLSKIFERFYRVQPRSQNANGSGLGLAIVKSIMRLHGGEVRVASENGRGSTFTLEFPVSHVPAR